MKSFFWLNGISLLLLASPAIASESELVTDEAPTSAAEKIPQSSPAFVSDVVPDLVLDITLDTVLDVIPNTVANTTPDILPPTDTDPTPDRVADVIPEQVPTQSPESISPSALTHSPLFAETITPEIPPVSPPSFSPPSSGRHGGTTPTSVHLGRHGGTTPTSVLTAQTTQIDQLSDVQPTDWSYQALRSLVEKYGIIAGLPNGTFEGNRPLTRYEFAAALSAAMDAIQTQQLQPTIDNAVATDDLETLQRLQQDYAAELATLRGRVDSLEARTAALAAHQFSSTVVLNGQSIFAVANSWGGDRPGDGASNPVFTQLTQLQLSGSFTGNDAFRVGLDASNFAGRGFAEPEVLNTNMALLSYQGNTNNQINLSSLEYRFAVGDRLVVTLKPVGFGLSSVLTPNTQFASAGQGALSRFAGEPTVFKIGNLDAGVGMDWLLSNRARLQVAYGVRDGGDNQQGIFSADHRALGVQLLTRPLDDVTLGIAYVNAFSDSGSLDTFTGSNNADTSGGFDERSTIHAVNGSLLWQVAPQLTFGATGGLTVTDSLPSDAAALSTTYLFSLGYADPFGRQGDLLGVMVGQPLRLRYGLSIPNEDEGAAMHYEVFYRFRLNDNIAITPGFFMVTDPGHIEENNTIFVGAIRTSFTF